MLRARNMSPSNISWADLTPDAIFTISECLDTHSDRLRFRAVCHSWRKPVPPPQDKHLLPKEMVFPSNINVMEQFSYRYVLFQSTIYRLEDPEGPPNDGWLIMVNESGEQGKFSLLNPFTMQEIEDLTEAYFPKELNSLGFRVTEVTKSFTLGWVRNEPNNPQQFLIGGANDLRELEHKAVLSSDFESDKRFYVISDSRLCSITVGEDYWSLLYRNIEYRDLASYNGFVYGVDRFGVVVETDEWSHDSITIPSPYPFMGDWYLVKSGGDLLLVGRDYSVCHDQVYYHNSTDSFIKRPGVREDVFVDFKICRLEEMEDGENQWEDVDDLGDTVLVLSRKWSFAIDASDFDGIKGNRIIFVDEVKYPEYSDADDRECDEFLRLLLKDVKVRVFDVEDNFDVPIESRPEYHSIFWPPPDWLMDHRPLPPHQTCRQ